MDDDFPETMVADIAKFFESEHTRLSGKDLYDDVFEVGTFFPLQRKRELVQMIQTARKFNPTTVMEIGTDKGGGLYHWCKCFPNVKNVIACEIRGTPYFSLFEKYFPNIKFLWIRDSHDLRDQAAVKRFLSENNTLMDCLFIDGDKGGFLHDFEDYLPLVNPKGVVFMHDIRDPGPVDAFATVVNRGYRTNRLLDVSESEEATEREKSGVPITSAYEAWLRHWKGASCSVGVVDPKLVHFIDK